MKKIIPVILSLLFLSSNAFPCSCLYGIYSFCHNASTYDMTVSGQVVYADTEKALLKLIDQFNGTEQNDTITVWSGPENSCSGPMDMTVQYGNVGDTIIVLLERITDFNIINNWDVVDDYRRVPWGCGTPILNVKNDSVFGEIYNNAGDNVGATLHFTEMKYSEFTGLWSKGSMDCSGLVGIEQLEIYETVKIFPNPANDKISIELPPGAGDLNNVTISDIAGNMLFRSQEISGIDISQIKSGIYFVLVETDKFVFRQKMVKQ